VGLSARDVRKLYRKAEKTAVICIMALRHAHHDLWRREAGLDETSPQTPPPEPPL
jgi:hypothetical protein